MVLKGTQRTRSHGALVYPWNSPIPIVFVEGDGSEMGSQFARATKSIMKRNLAVNLPVVEKILQKSKIKKGEYLKGIEAAISKYTESEYLDEIQAMAEASDSTYEDVLLLNANVDVLALAPAATPADSFSCSTFAAWGGATRDSVTIAGHNDDGNRVMDQYSVLKVAKPKHGNSFVCPQVPGYLAYDCLVNSRQVFVCGTAVDNPMLRSELVRDGVPNWVVYRWLGQFSSDAADAERRLLRTKNMTLKNWCFVSRKDGGKVVESTPKHHAPMRYPSPSKDWYGAATCVVCPELSKYTVKSDEPTSGVYRMDSVRHEVGRRYGEITPDSAVEILSSHYDSMRKREVPSEHTPCRHMEYEGKLAGTCRCMIASFTGDSDGRDGSTRIDVCLGNPCNGDWRQIELDGSFRFVSGYDEHDPVELELGRLLVSM